MDSEEDSDITTEDRAAMAIFMQRVAPRCRHLQLRGFIPEESLFSSNSASASAPHVGHLEKLVIEGHKACIWVACTTLLRHGPERLTSLTLVIRRRERGRIRVHSTARPVDQYHQAHTIGM